MALPQPEPDDLLAAGFFTPRLRPHTPPAPTTGPENLYWALVAQWRREGRHPPTGAGTAPAQDQVDG